MNNKEAPNVQLKNLTFLFCSSSNETTKCYFVTLLSHHSVYNIPCIVSLFPANVTITIFTPCFVVVVFVCKKRTRAYILSFISAI